ncbi:hypothetical protein ABSA28_00782 [Candidatus Hepatincolaceae symbiont of Richtersius coronifer]
MRFNSFSRNNNKAQDIEDYLEEEIADILNKKRFEKKNINPSEQDNKELMYTRRLQNSLNKTHNEQYLPFNKEELRPVGRDREKLIPKSSEVESLILQTLTPMIQQWLDAHLEEMVYKILKKEINTRNE